MNHYKRQKILVDSDAEERYQIAITIFAEFTSCVCVHFVLPLSAKECLFVYIFEMAHLLKKIKLERIKIETPSEMDNRIQTF